MHRRLLPLLLATALLAACMQEGEAPLEAGTPTTEDDGSDTSTTAGDELHPRPDRVGRVRRRRVRHPRRAARLRRPRRRADRALRRAHAGERRADRRAVRQPGRAGRRRRRVRRAAPLRAARGHHRALRHRRRRPSRRRRQHADRLRDDRQRAVRRRPHASRTPRTRRRYLEVSEEYVDDCEAKYGDLLPHVGTPDVARDMDVVRAAMGDEQLSYLGFSYGTAIGQVYADLFPDRVRSMVLDGVVELGPTGLELGRRAGRRVRDAPSTASCEYCDAAEGCATAGDTARGGRGGARAGRGARRDPRAGRRPRRRPRRGQPRHQLRALRAEPLARRSTTRSPTPLDGDGSGLVELADGYLGIGDFEVYFAVNCLDFAWPSGDPDAVLRAGQGHRRGSRRTSARPS